jgi:hypothetical protein
MTDDCFVLGQIINKKSILNSKEKSINDEGLKNKDTLLVSEL